MLKEKNSFNWILGVGYLVLALIILANFIYQKPESRAPGSKSHSETKEVAEVETLKMRLEENKRVMTEMNEMISRLQSGFRSDEEISGPPNDGSGINIPLILNEGLPAIEKNFDIQKRESPPKDSKKNPFLPFYDKSYREKSILESVKGRLFKIESHPQIPLPLVNQWNPPKVTDSLKKEAM